MKLIIGLTVSLALVLAVSGEQQRILRRVIKSTPTATQLGRVRLVTVRSASAESGGVAEISSKEAANFGQRSANETSTSSANSKSRPTSSSSFYPSTSTTSTPSPTTTTTTTSSTSTSSAPTPSASSTESNASERQVAGGVRTSGEVELLAGAPSSWQTMTAVEAPAAMLIATGTRAAQSDLASASSALHSSSSASEDESTGDFLRSSASSTKGGSYSHHQSVGETFSRLRQQQQQQSKTAQQSFFYPQQASKTSGATKTHWYQPPSTTPRPAPIIQQQRYEQQSEQYVEQQQQQQQQVEYGAAPLGQAEPFAFDFRTQDNSGNGQYRKEESDKDGVVRGSYGYTDAAGMYRHVEYVADQNGFRANIKSNEPGLIGETQPASIQLAGGAAPTNNQRLSGPNADSGDWIENNNNNNNNDQGSASADLALAPPDFESSHKSERLRSPRHFRN